MRTLQMNIYEVKAVVLCCALVVVSAEGDCWAVRGNGLRRVFYRWWMGGFCTALLLVA